jgi:hypothetical protein
LVEGRNAPATERVRATRELIERASPPPYLDLFDTLPAPGWTLTVGQRNKSVNGGRGDMQSSSSGKPRSRSYHSPRILPAMGAD